MNGMTRRLLVAVTIMIVSTVAVGATVRTTPVPGTFEAEDFDLGGEGIGYHDNTRGNSGQQYRRSEDVDIIVSKDSSGGRYVVNNFETGEWLAYTINVAQSGPYDFALRGASAFSNSAFHLEVDGRNVTGRVTVPNTGSWSTFQWVAAPQINLAVGQHVLKVVADQAYFDLNSIRGLAAPVARPYLGSAAAVPGTIEAENFDLGGQGVAYNDVAAGNAGGQYRVTEDVDIVSTSDSFGGTYDVNNFQTGEWLLYTIDAQNAGSYDVALRVASTYTTSAFRILIDGVDVTGLVSVPSTGSWSVYQWVPAGTITLTAGQHALKVVAAQEYFNLNSIRAAAPVVASRPYSGVPTAVPGVFEAENFDLGGEGLAYHDNVAGNAGGQYRPSEDVDIVASADASGAYDVNNFETGEWLAYTINVGAAASYEISLRAASALATGVYHIEIDSRNVTGSVSVPNTGSWTAYQWVGNTRVDLAAGRHVLKIVSDAQYFNLNSVRVAVPAAAPPPPPDPTTVVFSCTFPVAPTDCGFQEQSKVAGRARIGNVARDLSTAVVLHTEPGDNDVAGSGTMERDDLWLTQEATDGYEGREQWWAHSFYLPSDFVIPTWHNYVFFDFHNTNPGAGQANFHVLNQNGNFAFQGYGGVTVNNQPVNPYSATIGPIQKNVWYDFVYHVKWSSGPDGFFEAWVNGVKKLSHRGPTLYAGQGVYLKLANYHVPICDPYPACIGTHGPSSVIHDRVIRGTSALAVSSGPLEGVLGLVNGVLTPLVP
jgi:Carbohydrate binding module (family 6)/Polysaccharide lyase